jgi:hypothetical protein
MLVHHRMLAVIGIVTFLLAAGCSGGGRSAGPSASPSANIHASALEYAKCLRANGYPDFPDPIQDEQGGWTFPESAPNVKPDPEVCLPLGRNLKDLIRADQEKVTAAQMAQRREFAKCMRENGLPNFPDPDAEGQFTWPDGQAPAKDDQSMLQAEQTCQHYLPPKNPG